MDMTAVRAWCGHRQGLDGSLDGADPAAVLSRSGWARSVGGANPYLTLFSRAGTSRTAADQAVQQMAIYELPSARGCTYVLPAEHFALGLQVGRGIPEADLKVLERLGVARPEIDRLCEAVLRVLDTSKPLDPAQLKDELGDQVRNLGEEGRKKGQSTTLPAALGLLQAAGEIRRVPNNGRLDQQRYAYARWAPPVSPFSDAEARTELARLYYEWTAPASLAHFRWFSGYTAATAKAAIAPLDLVDVGDGLLAPPEVTKQLRAYKPPAKPAYSLVASIDAAILLRRDVPSLVSSDAAIPGEKHQASGVMDLPDHAILDRGRLVGLWQYDVEAGEIVAHLLGGGKTDKALHDAIARTETYVRADLGDVRSFSLDSPKSRAPRIAA